MRIAYISHYFVPEPAAPAARVHEFSRAWVRAGHEVSVLTAFPNHPLGVIPARYRGKLWATECLDGIRVVRNWLLAAPNRGVRRRGVDHLSFMVTAVLFGLPRLGAVDVVIASSPTLFSALSGWLIARVKRVPFVLEVRDLWPEAIIALGLMRPGLVVAILRRLARFLYRRAACIVVVTEAFAERIADQGMPRSKIVVVPNGADTHAFDAMPDAAAARARFAVSGFVVAYVGTHGISHGLDVVLDAAALQPEVTFLLVGDGAERDRLVAERDRRRLRNVTMLPSVSKADVPLVYAAADVSLVPLRDVPLFSTFVPSKLFEALAAGRPVIGSLRGEAASILERSGGGVVVPPGDATALASAIVQLRDDPAARAQMAERGGAFVRGHYDRDALAQRYLDVLLSLTTA